MYFVFRDKIHGAENYAYLSDSTISSARVYVDKRWACSKFKKYELQCRIDSVS